MTDFLFYGDGWMKTEGGGMCVAVVTTVTKERREKNKKKKVFVFLRSDCVFKFVCFVLLQVICIISPSAQPCPIREHPIP